MQSVSTEHQEELIKFMNFFLIKKEEALKELKYSLDDFLSDNVHDSIYNKEDVESLFGKFFTGVSKHVDDEIFNILKMIGVYINILMEQGERSGVSFKADLSFVESSKAREDIANLLKAGVGGSGGANLVKRQVTGLTKLPTIGSGYNNDPALLTKIDELQIELENLRNMNAKMQRELIAGAKEKRDSNDMLLLQKEIEDLKSELSKKLSESVQFNNLKKLMQAKNEQLKDLRQRLAKYETVDEGDG
eukprot:TRINITY_DN353_c0_g2_i1.p1 TRINITY_DN353_c0_g2~~TRINITY_DN353_c0_g2_i1.p1  ORF type:complete len:247 (+),score=85.00 TRINITY_DN353_c0_g2_i1:162-902(+)